MIRPLSALCLAILALGGPVNAQRMTLDTLSLYNLPGVWVQVSPLLPEAEADGLEADSLKRLIENAVGDAGIRVFSQEEWQVTLGNPMLGLTVNLIRPSEFLYLYNLELELRQLSTLPRDSLPVFGTTWTAGDVLGSIQTANLPDLRFHVARMVDRFVTSYVAARGYQRPWIRQKADRGG